MADQFPKKRPRGRPRTTPRLLGQRGGEVIFWAYNPAKKKPATEWARKNAADAVKRMLRQQAEALAKQIPTHLDPDPDDPDDQRNKVEAQAFGVNPLTGARVNLSLMGQPLSERKLRRWLQDAAEDTQVKMAEIRKGRGLIAWMKGERPSGPAGQVSIREWEAWYWKHEAKASRPRGAMRMGISLDTFNTLLARAQRKISAVPTS